jgi:hypothetical protein
LHEQRHVGDVLHHLHGEHDVEPLAGLRQLLGGGTAVVDRQIGKRGVLLRRLDVGRRRVYPHHVGAQPGQRLGQDAAAAADVEDAQALERVEPPGVAVEASGDPVADVADAQRIELVQRRHLAARVPPFGGQRREALDLGRVDRSLGAPTLRLAGHGLLLRG